MKENSALIRKYNVAGPRYTSYPTVPYWDNSPIEDSWKIKVKQAFDRSNASEGISIYVHIPFCESLCTYCGCNTRITKNHKVESPYLEALLKEWKLYLNVFGTKPRIKEIHLGGGTPTFFSPEHLDKLIKGLFEHAEIADSPEFGFEAHPNNTTTAHLQALYDNGFRRLSLGIQDFDEKVQKIVNRIQSYEDVERVTNTARQMGYESINFDLIYGLPLQKKASIIDTINKVKVLKPDRISFYSYAHVPWIKPGQRSFTEADLPQEEEKRELYEVGREMLEAVGYIEIGMDHFALKEDSLYKATLQKTLHRNFMGYTHSYTELMVGLGVSSISDTWDSFAQNVKKVEEYYDLVNANKIPIFRGHVLNEEDLIIRKHILNLMCKLETSWENESLVNQAVYDAQEKLTEMEQDGLIELYPFRLKITEKGKAFMRNICMCFDARLWRNVPQTELFSKTI